MKRILRVLLITLVIFFIIIQFIPNELPEGSFDETKDLLYLEQVPENIQAILKTSCYDCHSNQTEYPWYSHVAPVSWLVIRDIREGRDEVNFSDWGNLKRRSKIKVLSNIADEIKSGEMPLPIYLIIHRNAKLNDQQQEELIEWTNQLIDQIMGGE